MQDNLRLIVVVTGAKSEKERADEARKMLDWGFHGFEARVLFAEGQTIGHAKVFGGDTSYVPLVGPGTIRVMSPRNGSEHLLARIVYSGPVPAPVSKGQSIGKLKVWRGCGPGQHVATRDGRGDRADDRSVSRRREAVMMARQSRAAGPCVRRGQRLYAHNIVASSLIRKSNHNGLE